MTQDTNAPHSLQLLTAQLEQSLTDPTLDRDILDEQAQILNQLFATIMHDKVSKAFTGKHYYHDATQQWLSQALRIQKQCTDTVKTKATINYMHALTRPPKT
jgi:hypothetical protein